MSAEFVDWCSSLPLKTGSIPDINEEEMMGMAAECIACLAGITTFVAMVDSKVFEICVMCV